MRLLQMAILVSMAPIISAGQDFAGRWDVTVSDQGQTKAWWLELGPAGSGQGRFVGAPNGGVDPLHDLTVKDGELHFTVQWERKPPLNGVFTARLVDGKLQGDFTLEGKPRLTWTGKRSPVMADKDDGTWREGKPIQLFNGRDLSGWYTYIKDRGRDQDKSKILYQETCPKKFDQHFFKDIRSFPRSLRRVLFS